MKGFVPTPPPIVDLMVEKLFRRRPPTPDSTLLDPGCGEGEFVEGVIRWCRQHEASLPQIVGVEASPRRARTAAARFASLPSVRIREGDFLRSSEDRFDYVVANPPYVPITALSISERERYRGRYASASGRFDLYLLFFEQALKVLGPCGVLVFITPEKFLYVDTARPLRDILRRLRVEELHFLDESTFSGLVTYPLISTVSNLPPKGSTHIVMRGGENKRARFESSASWLPSILGRRHAPSDFTLADSCVRVSCGVATGADSVFVVRDDNLPSALRPFACPTISGRQLSEAEPLRIRSSMLVPYDSSGKLLPESQLSALGR